MSTRWVIKSLRCQRISKLLELPLVDEQLRIGAMSYSQARAISRVATAEKEELWVAYARRMPASQLDTLCRSYQNMQAYDQAHGSEAGAMAGAVAAAHVAALRTVTRRSLDDGMVKFEVVLPSDEAAIVWAALNAATSIASAEPTGAEPTSSARTGAAGTGAAGTSAAGTSAAGMGAAGTSAELTSAALTSAEPTPVSAAPIAQTPAGPPEPLLATPPTAKAPTAADRGRLRSAPNGQASWLARRSENRTAVGSCQ